MRLLSIGECHILLLGNTVWSYEHGMRVVLMNLHSFCQKQNARRNSLANAGQLSKPQ